MFSNILSLAQIVNSLSINILELDWLKSKKLMHKDDTFLTSQAHIQAFAFEFILVLVQPYWFLYKLTYSDTKYNEHTRHLQFQINDALTVL